MLAAIELPKVPPNNRLERRQEQSVEYCVDAAAAQAER